MLSEQPTIWQRLFRAGIKLLANGLAVGGYKISWVMGRLHQPKTERWQSNGGQQVLVIAPHPDDETVGCAGTIHRHKQAGDYVTILHITDGGKASSWLSPIELVRVRRREAQQASQALNADQFVWLGLPELTWQMDDLLLALQKIWQTRPSDVVYTTSRVDFHPDHQRVAQAVATALETGNLSPLVRLYQVHVPLTPTLTNLVAPVDSKQVKAVSAIYKTQVWSVARTIRMRRYAGLYHGVGFGEVFWEMPASDFIQLHGNAGISPKFRGLQYLPITDLLAYLSGRVKRERLRNIVN